MDARSQSLTLQDERAWAFYCMDTRYDLVAADFFDELSDEVKLRYRLLAHEFHQDAEAPWRHP